jgi:hypothetical protein
MQIIVRKMKEEKKVIYFKIMSINTSRRRIKSGHMESHNRASLLKHLREWWALQSINAVLVSLFFLPGL